MRAHRLTFLASLLLGACTVGPNYAGPPSLASAGIPSARFVRGADAATNAAPALANWWTQLADPVLDELEVRALQGSPSIAVSEARVRQARASVRLERANQYPSLSASAMYAHAELPGIDLGSGDSGGTSLNFYNLGLNASWEPDLFGGQRRTREAAAAQLGASLANVGDAQVQLTAEVAQAYVNLRERQQRLVTLGRTQGLLKQVLDLAQQRYRGGTATQFDVERARTQLNATGADTASAQADYDVYLDALAVLTGSAPGSLDATLKPGRPLPLPPAVLDVGDPASLIQRRPDIRAAERNIAAANARIGVAEAARFPKLSFMGILGLGGTSPSDLLDLGNISAIALPQLQWNFLDFGRGRARVEQARGALDEADAQYRQTVLGALQDAEDSLSRFGHQRQTVAHLAEVARSADHSAALMRQRYKAGVTTLTDTLDAERQSVVAHQNLTSATAVLTGAFVAVEKALGLGWQPAGQRGRMTASA